MMDDKTRERIYDIIEKDDDNDMLSKIYDLVMIIVIGVSLLPLMVKEQSMTLFILDKICAAVFIIDYILRLITADFKLKDKSHPYLRYPFTPMAVIDLISILPSLIPLSREMEALRALKVFRVIRFLRVLRIVRFFRYSRSINRVIRVIRDSRDALLAVCSLAMLYIFVSALVVFNVEPDTFKNFFEALYWATVSLATIGYGDITPVSAIGRLMTMISAIFGIAVVALPAGVITAGYLKELDREAKDKDVYYDD